MGKNILINEKGLVLIIALLLLLVLTLIGISSINTTSFDNIITGNERLSNAAFYASEAGIAVGVTRIPLTDPIPRTGIGDDTSYSANINYLGQVNRPGTDTTWVFRRYQVMATGVSMGARKQVEVQVRFGPVSSGTNY